LGELVAGSVMGAMLVVTTGCSWFTAFVEQPKLDPWEAVSFPGKVLLPSRGNPQNSVPITGTFVSGLQVSYAPLPGTIDSMSAIQNPTPPTGASLVNGRKLYQINCAVCHGEAGQGNGPATKYGIFPINLTTDVAKAYTDGYIYGMIRNGRGSMPTYNRIEEMDRWDLINYLRGLQGKLAQPVPVGPVGYPGQTGDALPLPTVDAPTRPAPYTVAWLDSARAIHAQTPGIKASIATAPPKAAAKAPTQAPAASSAGSPGASPAASPAATKP
jgi:mono/diheme cytochrome c family protein